MVSAATVDLNATIALATSVLALIGWKSGELH